MEAIKRIKRSKRRQEFHRLLSHISSMFARMGSHEFNDVVNQSLKMLSNYTNADRVYIFKYDIESYTSSNIFEYCEPGIPPFIEFLQKVPMHEMHDWMSLHTQGLTYYLPDVNRLDKNDAVFKTLEPQGVKSMIAVPLLSDEELYGFIGFDSVRSKRKYAKFEQFMLSEFGNVLLNALKRIEYEDKFRLESERMHYLIEASDIASWEWEIKSGKTVFNNKWAEIIGYTLDEISPVSIETWKRFTHPDDLKAAEDALNQVFNRQADKYIAEFRMIHKSGKEVWVRDTGRVIEWDGNQPIRMYGTHMDITDIKQKEIQLQTISKAIHFSSAAIVITDKHGNIEFVNPRFTDITGYTSDEVIGKNPRILKSNYHDELFYRNMWKTLTRGLDWEGEFCNLKKDGSIYWESALISPIIDDRGKIVNYIAVKTDISEKMEFQKLAKEYNEQLAIEVQEKMAEIEESQRATINAMARLTETRDYETGQHVDRVQHLSKALAIELRKIKDFRNEINQTFINNLFYASALHDIGKISIPDTILLKQGKLTNEEFDIIKKHVQIGANVLNQMAIMYPQNEIIRMATKIAQYHHEWFNGNGYLEGLKGEEIPLSARILAIVDVYDALRSARPYKEALSHEKAVEIIQLESETHFDPRIVEAFVKINDQFDTIYNALI